MTSSQLLALQSCEYYAKEEVSQILWSYSWNGKTNRKKRRKGKPFKVCLLRGTSVAQVVERLILDFSGLWDQALWWAPLWAWRLLGILFSLCLSPNKHTGILFLSQKIKIKINKVCVLDFFNPTNMLPIPQNIIKEKTVRCPGFHLSNFW